MGDNTGIEWTDSTWNPVTGCTEVSPGCDHCYAKTLAERFRGTPGHYFQNGFDVQLRPTRLEQPLRWTRPRRIFVNSMSDLFHDAVPDDYIAQVFAVMALAGQHTFQVLTKRHGRMRSLLNSGDFQQAVFDAWSTFDVPGPDAREYDEFPAWPLPNVWLGVSVENQQWADIRIPALLATPAAVRFLSMEPLLGPVDLTRLLNPERGCNCNVPAMEGAGVHSHRCACMTQPEVGWVIVGGESGTGARPMHPDWVRSLRDQCTNAGVPFHFKQWGEWAPSGSLRADGSIDYTDPTAGMDRIGKKAAGRDLDGRTWDQFPQAVIP